MELQLDRQKKECDSDVCNTKIKTIHKIQITSQCLFIMVIIYHDHIIVNKNNGQIIVITLYLAYVCVSSFVFCKWLPTTPPIPIFPPQVSWYPYPCCQYPHHPSIYPLTSADPFRPHHLPMSEAVFNTCSIVTVPFIPIAPLCTFRHQSIHYAPFFFSLYLILLRALYTFFHCNRQKIPMSSPNVPLFYDDGSVTS